MTTPEPPPPPMLPPVAYATLYTAPPANRRPTSVAVLAVIGICLAAMALLAPFSLAGQWLVTRMPAGRATTGPAAAIQSQMSEGPIFAWSIFAAAVQVALGAALLYGSIQSLRLRPAGRRVMVGYAAIAIPWTIVGTLVAILYILPRTMAMIAPPGAGGLPSWAVAIGVASSVIGGLIALVYPTCVLVFLRRPAVVAAFEPDAASGA